MQTPYRARIRFLEDLIESLWESYAGWAVYAQQCRQAITNLGGTYVNDHIAFRTFGLPGHGRERLARLFEALGYRRRDNYLFEQKKLVADWFSPPESHLPKIFISELQVRELSPEAQARIRAVAFRQNLLYPDLDEVLRRLERLTAGDHGPMLDLLRVVFTQLPWQDPEAVDYHALRSESEYAAWVSIFGNRVNHFTQAVHFSDLFSELEEMNRMVDELNIPLNDSGGRIKGTPGQLLEQSSTVANVTWHRFPDGTAETLPYAYFEFAFRHLLPSGRDGRSAGKAPAWEDYYHGFIAASADRIFESTDVSQVYRDRAGRLEAIPLQHPPAMQPVPPEDDEA
ncbi:MAG: DUF1338 domain-containing protein [Acidobacteriota bacterium]|jgi:hypothetical protein